MPDFHASCTRTHRSDSLLMAPSNGPYAVVASSDVLSCTAHFSSDWKCKYISQTTHKLSPSTTHLSMQSLDRGQQPPEACLRDGVARWRMHAANMREGLIARLYRSPLDGRDLAGGHVHLHVCSAVHQRMHHTAPDGLGTCSRFGLRAQSSYTCAAHLTICQVRSVWRACIAAFRDRFHRWTGLYASISDSGVITDG